MSLNTVVNTTRKISLDIYQPRIVTVNAKQLDTRSRFINVICTDSGKKITLNASNMTAFVRCTKSDSTIVFDEAEIINDGTVLFELIPQMLTSIGRATVDIAIINEAGLQIEDFDKNASWEELGLSTLSTMSFYLNVYETAFDQDEVESSNEFNALLGTLGKVLILEDVVSDLEDTVTTNEDIRQNNEANRQDAEIKREQAKEECIEATNNANDATDACKKATEACIEATEESIISTENCDVATQKCIEATDKCNSVIDKTGVVLVAEKGVANGVATLDENAKVPLEQLNLTDLMNIISQLQEQIDSMHKVRYGTNAPDNSVGVDGDIYMRIID